MLSRTHSLLVYCIYRCKRKNLDTMYNTDQSERRCEIMEDGSQKPFSLNHAINDELPAVTDEDVSMILDLAKPYRGSSCELTKWRCYILAIGSVASAGYRPLSRSRTYCPSPPPLPTQVLGSQISFNGSADRNRNKKNNVQKFLMLWFNL